MNLVQADVGSDIFESVGAEVAEEANFALAVFGLADRGEVDPDVVVIVEGGNAVGAGPVGFGEFCLVEGFAVIIAPESYCRSPHLAKREIHPAVVIEVECRYSYSWHR